MVRGFPPIARPDARVLVLGSMPGVASLAAGEYYAHPRNAFWPLAGELFGAGPDLAYPERCARLAAARVALWDVLARCRRSGSADAEIEPDSERANDFAAFLRAHPRLRRVFFNGAKAERAWRRHVAPLLGAGAPPAARLPSTSPAHAGLSRARKLVAWRAVAEAAAGRDPAPARG